MIRARFGTPADRIVARLTGKAAGLARAEAENRLRARLQDAARWQAARLLWPLFTSGR